MSDGEPDRRDDGGQDNVIAQRIWIVVERFFVSVKGLCPLAYTVVGLGWWQRGIVGWGRDTRVMG
jgi:hypothetical protein